MERGGHGEGAPEGVHRAGQLPGNLLGRRGRAGQDHGNHAGGSQSSVKFVHFKMRPSSHPRQPGECKLIEHCVIHSLSIPGNLVTCNFKVYITIHFFSLRTSEVLPRRSRINTKSDKNIGVANTEKTKDTKREKYKKRQI